MAASPSDEKEVMYIESREFLKKIRLNNGWYVPEWLLGGDLAELKKRALENKDDHYTTLWLIYLSHILLGTLVGVMVKTPSWSANISTDVVFATAVCSTFLSLLAITPWCVLMQARALRLNAGEKQKFETIGKLLSLRFIPDIDEDQDASVQNAVSIALKLGKEQKDAEKRYEIAESEQKSVAEVELDHARSVFTEHFNVMKSAGLLSNITRGDLFKEKPRVKTV